MKKSTTEEQIHARLRELSDEVRRMRREFSDDQQRASRVDRLSSKLGKPASKPKPPQE